MLRHMSGYNWQRHTGGLRVVGVTTARAKSVLCCKGSGRQKLASLRVLLPDNKILWSILKHTGRRWQESGTRGVFSGSSWRAAEFWTSWRPEGPAWSTPSYRDVSEAKLGRDTKRTWAFKSHCLLFRPDFLQWVGHMVSGNTGTMRIFYDTDILVI